MSKLKPIFIDPELKRLIECYKSDKEFKDIGSALIDLLNGSDKFLRLNSRFGNKGDDEEEKEEPIEEIKIDELDTLNL